MFKRQRTGSVVCASCGSLVGVNDDRCYSCGRRNPGLWGFGPMLRQFGNDLGFISLVVYGCAAVYIATVALTMVLSGPEAVMGGGNFFAILGPQRPAIFLFGATGSVPVFKLGRWWTLLSASWLHGGILHILFNMMAVRQLAPPTADIYGAGRMVIIYTIAGVVGFAASTCAGEYLWWMPIPFLRGGDWTLGASASIFGLLGSLVYYGKRGGSSLIHREAMANVAGLFIMGLILPGIDNYAHAGGFAGGYLAAMWLDPLKPERMDHFVGAALCIVLSALSIIVSIITGLPLLLGRG
jgi:membrane associated rhomboid family serine protease